MILYLPMVIVFYYVVTLMLDFGTSCSLFCLLANPNIKHKVTSSTNKFCSLNPTPVTVQTSLEANFSLDADVGSCNISSIKRQVDACGPVSILPLKIDGLVGCNGGGDAIIISKRTLPCKRDVSVTVQGRSNSILIIELTGESNRLSVLGSSDGNLSSVLVVVDDNIRLLGLNVVTRVDGNTSSIRINSLDSGNSLDSESISSTGLKIDVNIKFIIGCFNFNGSLGEISSFELSTSGYSPSVKIGGSLTPDVLGKGCNIGSGASRCFNTVLNVYISRGGGCRPRESRVKSS